VLLRLGLNHKINPAEQRITEIEGSVIEKGKGKRNTKVLYETAELRSLRDKD
jgi:hypothetical protein